MTENFYDLLERNDGGDAALTAIQAGLPVNQHLRDGSTPLFVAAMWGQERIVDALIDAGAYVNLETKNHTRQSPLHAATQWGWKAISHRLIAAGASVQSVDGMKATPLHNAASMGFVEICRLLLEKGADVSAKNKFKGATPLHVAVTNGAQGVGEYEIQALEREMASEGFYFPQREPHDYAATVSLLLKQGLSRREVSKAAKWARIYNSDEMTNLLTFHGAR